jgi:hypothetical protein
MTQVDLGLFPDAIAGGLVLQATSVEQPAKAKIKPTMDAGLMIVGCFADEFNHRRTRMQHAIFVLREPVTLRLNASQTLPVGFWNSMRCRLRIWRSNQ